MYFKDASYDEFYNSTVSYRLLWMILIFTLFRFRFFIAWTFAEFSCFTASKAVPNSIEIS